MACTQLGTCSIHRYPASALACHLCGPRLSVRGLGLSKCWHMQAMALVQGVSGPPPHLLWGYRHCRTDRQCRTDLAPAPAGPQSTGAEARREGSRQSVQERQDLQLLLRELWPNLPFPDADFRVLIWLQPSSQSSTKCVWLHLPSLPEMQHRAQIGTGVPGAHSMLWQQWLGVGSQDLLFLAFCSVDLAF